MKNLIPGILISTVTVFLSASSLMGVENIIQIPADKWLPVSGKWEIENGKLKEFSDTSAPGNKPFWTLANPSVLKNYRLEADVEVSDGAGSLYMAILWQNEANYYTLKYSDPHSELSIIQVTGGTETVLAQTADKIKLKPKLSPVNIGFQAENGLLTVFASGKKIIETHSSRIESGYVALGEKDRCVTFSNMKIIPLGEKENRSLTVKYESKRKVFKPEEKQVEINISITNPGKTNSEKCKLFLDVDGFFPKNYEIPLLAPSGKKEIKYVFNSNELKSGDYQLSCVLKRNGGTFQKDAFEISVAPPVNPYCFETLCWDSAGTSENMKKLGFTAFARGFFLGTAYDKEKDTYVDKSYDRSFNVSEQASKNGLYNIIRMHSQIEKGIPSNTPEALIKGKNGKPHNKLEVCPNHRETQEYIKEFSGKISEKISSDQTVKYVSIDSEVENEERKLVPCHDKICFEKMKEAGFEDYPENVDSPWCMVGAAIWKTPEKYGVKDGIIDDSNKYYRFMKWWWKDGNGFSAMRKIMAENMKKKNPSLKIFHDPVLRRPPFRGNAPGMDFISHWTYTNHSPMSFSENTDELLAAGTENQRVCPTLQLFWYSNSVGPDLKSAEDKKKAREEKNAAAEVIDAVSFGRFITISPDNLKESVWLAISRPIDMIMFDGGSAISTQPGSYDFTNPATPLALEEITKELIKPYGPMLKDLMRRPEKVAFLDSAASCLFGRTGNFGNANKYMADCYNTVMLAQIQPVVLYDDSIIDGTLGKFKVLIIPEGRVLLRSVYDKILSFVKSGGIVIADNSLKAEIPASVKFDFPTTEGMTALKRQQAWTDAAAALKKLLISKGFQYDITADSQDVVIARRFGDNTTAFFIINDRKKPGEYLGKYGKVLDDGVPQTVKVHFSPELTKEGIMYDALTRKEVKLEKNSADFFLTAAGGALIVKIPEKIEKIEVAVPGKINRKTPAEITVRALGRKGSVINAAIPLKISITDSAGIENAYSGFYTLKNGTFKLQIPLALNDRTGYWTIHAEELLSGISAKSCFSVDNAEK
ncbi:MAG: hypothetical protein A2017_14240 [Lentisphaerae bacterium GWF2_44_16]|nr:MAG: hypothetical protein A2017_14240 [Lentisphaerae bacterium GWF2_44_16]